MAIMSFGERMKSAYLERVKFREGVDLRFSILSIDKVVAQQYHFINYNNDKGSKECIGSICCAVEGTPQQRYYVPVWVYLNPQQSFDGLLQALPLSTAQYEDFVKWEEEYRRAGSTVTKVDWSGQTHKQGQGTRTTFQAMPGNRLLDWAPPELHQKILASMEGFYRLAETSLQTPMTHASWVQLFQNNNIDLSEYQQPSPNEEVHSLPAPAVVTSLPQGAPSGFGIAGVPIAPVQEQWMLAMNGKTEGPFNIQQIQQAAQQNRINSQTMAWKEGMANWQALGEVPQFAVMFKVAPPPAPAQVVTPIPPPAPAAPVSVPMPPVGASPFPAKSTVPASPFPGTVVTAPPPAGNSPALASPFPAVPAPTAPFPGAVQTPPPAPAQGEVNAVPEQQVLTESELAGLIET